MTTLRTFFLLGVICKTLQIFADQGTGRIDFLLDKLEVARDFKVRIAAAEELGKISDGSVADWMLKAFKKESNAAVRLSILQAIAQIPDVSILNPVVSMTQEMTLSENERLTIERIVWTFRKAIHLPNWEAVLVTLKNEKLRRIAAWLLGLSDKPYVLRSLYAAIKEPSPLLKQTIYQAISRLGQNKELNFCNSAKLSEKMPSAIKAAETCASFIKMKMADVIPEPQTPYVILNSELKNLPEGAFSPQGYV